MSFPKKAFQNNSSTKESKYVEKMRLLNNHARAGTPPLPLNMFVFTGIVRSRKYNQLLRLNFGGVEKYLWRFL